VSTISEILSLSLSAIYTSTTAEGVYCTVHQPGEWRDLLLLLPSPPLVGCRLRDLLCFSASSFPSRFQLLDKHKKKGFLSFVSFRFFFKESANSRCRVLKVLGREEGRGVDRISRTADIFTTRPFLFLRLLSRNTHHDEDDDAL
jgi:hypothetical protein